MWKPHAELVVHDTYLFYRTANIHMRSRDNKHLINQSVLFIKEAVIVLMTTGRW